MKEKGLDWAERFKERRRAYQAEYRARKKAASMTVTQKSPQLSKETQHRKEVINEYRRIYKVNDRANREATPTVIAQKSPELSGATQRKVLLDRVRSDTVAKEHKKHVYGLRSSPKKTERGEELQAEFLKHSPKKSDIPQSVPDTPKETRYVNAKRYIYQKSKAVVEGPSGNG